jgi:hypothetical protein
VGGQVKRTVSADGAQVRYAEDTRYPDREATLDEVFVTEPQNVHLEQMSDSGWWLCIVTRGGRRLDVNISAKRAHVNAFAEWDA